MNEPAAQNPERRNACGTNPGAADLFHWNIDFKDIGTR
jgi:hypothetical protein